MTYTEMLSKIETLNTYEKMITDLKEQAEAIKTSFKNEMLMQNVDTLIVGEYLIHYTDVISNRFDSTNFKRVYPELYKNYTRPVASRRFTISV